LDHDPPAGGSQPHANRYLALSSRGPRQQQVGNVETSHQENNADHCHHHAAAKFEIGEAVRRNAGLKRRHAGEAAAVVSTTKCLLQICRYGIQLGLRLLRAGALLKTRYSAEAHETTFIEKLFECSREYLVMHGHGYPHVRSADNYGPLEMLGRNANHS